MLLPLAKPVGRSAERYVYIEPAQLSDSSLTVNFSAVEVQRAYLAELEMSSVNSCWRLMVVVGKHGTISRQNSNWMRASSTTF